MKGPVLNYRPPPMPPAEQFESARIQIEHNARDLEGATWAIHPVDLEELRSGDGGKTLLHGLRFTIPADPELAGMGPRLVWADEWPAEWHAIPPKGPMGTK